MPCSLEQAVSSCRHVLLRARREDGLMQHLCDLLVASGFPLVWVGMVMPTGRYGDIFTAGKSVDVLKNLPPRMEPARSYLLAATPKKFDRVDLFAPEDQCALVSFPILDGERVIAGLHICSFDTDYLSQKANLLTELAEEIGLRMSEIRCFVQSDRDVQHVSFRGFPEPLWIQDRETLAIREVNRAAVQLYGYSREEFLQMTLADIQPAEQSPFLNGDPQSSQTEFQNLGVWQHRLKEGRSVDVEITARSIEFGERPALLVSAHDVTQWKRMEQALHESEERFRATFEQAAVGIAHLGLDGHFLRVNPCACTFWGYSVEELLRKTFQDITYPNDRDWSQASIQQLLAGSISTTTLNKRYVRADASIVWAHVTLSLVRDSAGQPSYCIMVMQDTSTQRWMESSLRDSEMRFRSAFEQAAVGMAYLNMADTRSFRVNRALCDLLLYSAESLLQRNIIEWFHRDDQDMVMRQINRLLEGRVERFSCESRLMTRDKQNVWCYVTVSLVRDSSGTPLYLYAIVKDVSARKRAEEMLSESEMRYRRMIETMQEGVWYFDESGRTRYVNQRMAALMGYERAEILDHRMSDFIAEADAHFDYSLAAAGMGSEIQLCRRDGGYIWVIAVSTPILGDFGQFLGTLVIVTDIDQRKRMELENARHLRELTALYEIGQKLQSIHDPHTLAAEALKILASAVEYTLGALVTVNDSRDRLILLAVNDEAHQALQKREKQDGVASSALFPDRGMIGWVIHNGQSLCVGDVLNDPHYVAVHSDIRSELCVPLLNNEQQVIGAINLESSRVNAYSEKDQSLLEALAFQIAVMLENANLVKELQRANAEQVALSRRLVAVQENERRQLARELHDQIGQTLTGLSLSLEMSNRRLGGDTALVDSRRVVDDLLRRVRDLSLNLRPAMLDDLGLLPALVWLCEHYEKQTQIRVTFEHEGLEGRFSPEIESASYRIVQEALTNVARYSGSMCVEVMASAVGDELSVQVRDHGRGFDATRVMTTSTGLLGMRDRARELGGRFDVRTSPGEGVCLCACFPLAVNTSEEL
jgi:PAS domain S-box-containing protein